MDLDPSLKHSLCLHVQATLCVGSHKVWTQTIHNYKVKTSGSSEFKVYLPQMSHLQNNSKNSNYTRAFCNYYGHHLVVICKLLHRSGFGWTIKDVAPVWEGLDGDQTHSSLAMWRQQADMASMSPCCLQTLILVFICSFENRGMVLEERIGPAPLPLMVIQRKSTAASSPAARVML